MARYRTRRNQPVTRPLLKVWLGWSHSKAWRVYGYLLARGFLTVEGELGPAFHEQEGANGVLKVPIEWLALGDLDSLALAQLQSWASLRAVHTRRGFAEVRQGFFGRFLGVCAKTVGDVLKRLSTGLTVGVKRLHRMGKKADVRARLALNAETGRATYVRLLGEREAKVMAPKPPTPPVEAERPRYVPSDDELLGMIGGGRTGPPTSTTA